MFKKRKNKKFVAKATQDNAFSFAGRGGLSRREKQKRLRRWILIMLFLSSLVLLYKIHYTIENFSPKTWEETIPIQLNK